MSTIPSAENLYQILLKQLKEYQLINHSFQLAGLASGGAWIAERLAQDLQLKTYGVINVSFYRDDYQEKGIKVLSSSAGMSTELPFEVEGAHIILIDDILDSGRTVRAALNELFDYGRPRKVDLAVLLDRDRRQLPVEASFKGAKVTFSDDQILVLEQTLNCHFKFTTEFKKKY